MAEYSADMAKVFAGSRHIADAVRYCEQLPSQLEDALQRYYGWWGVEGGDDEFANTVGPACLDEQKKVLETLQAITGGLTALIDAVAAQAKEVQKPQMDALDDLSVHGSTDPNTKR
jgi:hypothetical protein